MIDQLVLPQSFYDALAGIVFPGMASVHLLLAFLAVLRTRQYGYRRYWYLIPVYLLFMSAAFAALALGLGPPAVLDVTTARNWARVLFGLALGVIVAFVCLYLAEQFQRRE